MGIELTAEFESALDLLEYGSDSHLFLTGRAGTGKSTLLGYWRYITTMHHAVLAPTGVSAINVGGQTIHSFFRFKPGVTVQDVDSHEPTGAQIYKELGETKKATKHRKLHDRYRPDDTARGRAARLARQKYPAANDAADEPVIYSLNRDEDERASQNR